MKSKGIYRRPSLRARPQSPTKNSENEEEMRVRETADAVAEVLQDLPEADNAAGAVDRMLQANGILRNLPWPAPFDRDYSFAASGRCA
jgi:hypothetical protein